MLINHGFRLRKLPFSGIVAGFALQNRCRKVAKATKPQREKNFSR